MTDHSDLVDKVAQAIRKLSRTDRLSEEAIAQAAIDAMQLSEVRTRLNNAVKAVYANIGPSPVLVEIRLAQELLGGAND